MYDEGALFAQIPACGMKYVLIESASLGAQLVTGFQGGLLAQILACGTLL